LKVAIIGWGSLIWNPGNMNLVFEKWRNDGPKLPIEFARKSRDGRITLVIYERYLDVPNLWVKTYWNLIEVKNLDEAIEILKERERTIKEYIGYVSEDLKYEKMHPKILEEIEQWRKSKELDGAVWTALPSNVNNTDEIISYLQSLTGDTLNKAREYIEKTPKQIQTPLRKKFEEILGWKCVSKV